MSQDKIQAPSSSTGLMRFYDVTSSNILLEPKTVLIFAVAFIVLELILHVIKV
ncbi:hypothetical protein COT29_02000 [Candidatus Micrarchaeota archaeon CG08_land_8_20_14_0_20_59_11]|nr:MAG: hypothetical protein COT29_02000 [Candidatus Micrarchaeota archaeon CG08_land_8_20_14_0_20_59_11]